jgi:FAD/FMN-containing dehydrogenase
MTEHTFRQIEPAEMHSATRSTRRSFVKLAAASTLASGVAWLQGSRTYAATASPSGLGELPRLDGDLLFDATDRQAATGDFGYHIYRSPIAVLKPKSVDDVIRIISYANKRDLKVAMRGQGHCLYGQSQVDGGIIIDSSTLSAISVRGNKALDAQPGALWGDVTKAALDHALTPPVLPDAMMLTVGGTLSVGGMGETSYRFGAQVDHTLELDVVTGAGEFVTCSPERSGELFRMVLAGLGQCGIIVRARLRLTQAPKYVAIRTLMYDDMDVFLADQARLTTIDDVHLLNGRLTREQDGRWRFALIAGTFVTDADEGNRRPSWLAGLRQKSEVAPTTTSYWDYLNRRTASITASKTRKNPNPSLVLTLPSRSAQSFLTHVLSNQDVSIGIWFFEVSPKITAKFTQPLAKMPAGDLSYELRMQRKASTENAPDHRAMLAANQALLPLLLAAGGKVYPPFAPILSREQWQEHYGMEAWARFVAAKKRFDPNNVLTPGAGIF